MDRKLFYLFTFSLFFLFCPSAVCAEDAVKGGFPFDGGTTSDSVVISNVKMTYFEVISDKNRLVVAGNNKKSTLKFKVKVPEGKVVSLTFRELLNIAPMDEDEGLPEKTDVSITVQLDKETVVFHEDPTSVCYNNDEIVITGTEDHKAHEISFEAHFKGKNCKYTGMIEGLSVHVHEFGDLTVSREPLCGVPGQSYSTCSICGKKSLFKVEPQYQEHKLVLMASTEKRSSCMSNVGSVSKCEQCPYSEIKFNGELMDHEFDAEGVCSVCHLRMPKCNVDSSVYEVYNAAEMRVLAEMVSLGRVSGNVGIDIKADLVFNKDITMLPLGTFDHPFQGVLNGNGHRISGIANSYQDADCLGFVGVAKGTLLSHAVIANLIFDGGNSLKGEACVGGIVGYATNCDIINCASFGVLEGSDYVGGIVGYADQQVSILNSASVVTIRTQGKWNTMVCGMPLGHILNSYGAATNTLGGSLDELETTTLRHCFSSQGSADGLKQISQNEMSSYAVVQMLNEESETPCFMMSETDNYPIPVVNSDVKASTNRALPMQRASIRRHRAPSADADGGNANAAPSEKDREVEVMGGYVDENAFLKIGRPLEEVVSKDSVQYADFNRVYIVARSVPLGFKPYERISGGRLLDFESWLVPADSSFAAITEYEVVSQELVKPRSETVIYNTAENNSIDQYTIEDGAYSLTARLSFEGESNMVYHENVDGILKPAWSLEMEYDESTGKATATNIYSHDRNTGEVRLEYNYAYSAEDQAGNTGDGTEEEYFDSLTNTIHIIETYPDLDEEGTISRDHYILRASDDYLMEIREEKMIDGQPYLTDGIYFIYDDEGALEQSVAFRPVDDDDLTNSELRPYIYYDYVGFWKANPYPTSIKVPTTTMHSSLKKRMDFNVYDAQGRVVRRVTDMNDPFNGLPRGLYIYQGSKYLKK